MRKKDTILEDRVLFRYWRYEGTQPFSKKMVEMSFLIPSFVTPTLTNITRYKKILRPCSYYK
jgi:hypothetical protein